MLDEDKIRDRRFTSFSLVDTSANEISQPLGSDSVPKRLYFSKNEQFDEKKQ